MIVGLALLHAGAIVCSWVVPLPWVLRAVAALTLSANFAYCLRRAAGLFGRQSLRQVRIEPHGIVLGLGDEPAPQWVDCHLDGCFVHPWLTILRLRTTPRDRRIHAVLGRDAMSAEDGRRLRQHLRQRAPGAVSDQPA